VGDQIIYLIDTDVLVAIRKKRDSESIYSHLRKMATDGDLKTVRQVFEELETFGQGYRFLFDHKSKFLLPIEKQYSLEVQEKIEVLKKKASYLWEQTGLKNPADPWLVAAASANKFTLVTNEGQNRTTRIPAACKISETWCRCISGPHFLYEVGLVTMINPAHISTDAFFSDPG
jgi:putative component of toxin-antitoxin plasmid stabilization module